MRIQALIPFLDGARRFEAGDVCTVPDADGERFIGHGWAVQEGSAPASTAGTGSTDLNVHGSTLGVADTQGA